MYGAFNSIRAGILWFLAISRSKMEDLLICRLFMMMKTYLHHCQVYVLDSSLIWRCRISNICFDFFKCACLKKTITNVRNSTWLNRWATKDISNKKLSISKESNDLKLVGIVWLNPLHWDTLNWPFYVIQFPRIKSSLSNLLHL